jgi:hypothetical protein
MLCLCVLLQESPGVSFKQGNGPRDLGISIRGSNARNGFGIRNIVLLEDGFLLERHIRRYSFRQPRAWRRPHQLQLVQHQTVNAFGTYSPTPDDRFTAPKKSSRRVAYTSKRVGDAVYVQGKQASTAA